MTLVAAAAAFAVMDLSSNTFLLVLRHAFGLTRAFNREVCQEEDRHSRKEMLRVRGHVRLDFEIIEHLEIGVQILILFECLQVAYRRARLGCDLWRHRH